MNRVNFLPDGYLETRFRRRSAVVCATLMGVVIGGVVVMALAFRLSIKQLHFQEEMVQQRCGFAYQKLLEIKKKQAAQQEVARQAMMTAAVLQDTPRSSILSEIGRALPVGVSLTDLNVQPNESAQGDANVILRGNAVNETRIADLTGQLKRSKLFSNVTRIGFDVTNLEGRPRPFEIDMKLVTTTPSQIQMPEARSETVFLNPE